MQVYNLNDEEITHHLTVLADCIIWTHHCSLAHMSILMSDILFQLDTCDINADAIQHSCLMMPPSLHLPALSEMTAMTMVTSHVQHVSSTRKDAKTVQR